MADEESFITLLVASERVGQWLDVIRAHHSGEGSLSRVKHAVKELVVALENEAYAEEARQQGAVPLLTGLMKRTDDTGLLELVIKAVAASAGGSAKLRTFSYGGVPVVLKEGALGDGVGAKVWTCGHTFNRLLAQHPEIVRGRSVLEIGSGCGACGIMAAKLGAQRVLLTDYVDAVLRNLRDCMHLNSQPEPQGDASASSAAEAAADTHAANGATEEDADPEDWDPEDASECGSEDFDALLAEGLGAGGGSGTPAKQRQQLPQAWDAPPMHVRFYDWQDSVNHVDEQARAALAATAAGGGAAHGKSIDSASNDSGAPGMDAEEQYDVILGTEILYEWPMVEMVPAVLKHRLRPGGRVLLCCAVREQAMFDSFAAALATLGLRVGITAVQPQADDAGLLDIRHDYEGGYVLVAVEHEDAPADDWHAANLFPSS